MESKSIIGEKGLAFAKRIAKCYRFLTEKKHEGIMSKQLLRCGTGVGANVREGQYAQSKKDFISKMNIASKRLERQTTGLMLFTLLATSRMMSILRSMQTTKSCSRFLRL